MWVDQIIVVSDTTQVQTPTISDDYIIFTTHSITSSLMMPLVGRQMLMFRYSQDSSTSGGTLFNFRDMSPNDCSIRFYTKYNTTIAASSMWALCVYMYPGVVALMIKYFK